MLLSSMARWIWNVAGNCAAHLPKRLAIVGSAMAQSNDQLFSWV